MAKAKNPYQNLDLEFVKGELTKSVNYLAIIDIDSIDDEIETVVNVRGGSAPTVISSVEQKLDSYIVTIKDSITQLKYITSLEGEVSTFVESLLVKLEKHIFYIERYFLARPLSKIKNREHLIPMVTVKGKPYTARIIAANIPAQIKSRSKFLNIILSIKPVVSGIKEARTEELKTRGGAEIPVSLLDFVKRVNK